MQRRNRHIVVLLVLLWMTIMSGCGRKSAYLAYSPISPDGWTRQDTLRFNIPTIKDAGDYCMLLGLRSDNDYPFMNISLIVEQKLLPEGSVFVDTIYCDVTRENGRSWGSGVNLYQYVIDIDTLYLDQGDSLSITIRHDIKTDTLKGISDVGLELVK